MKNDYGSGSLATFLLDLFRSEPRQDDLPQHTNYRDYLKSDHWQLVSGKAKLKAGYRCQLCNDKGKLNVHHRTYERLWHEKNEDLIVLCERCHHKFHRELP